MGSEWRETTLGEFAPFNYGKGLPKRKRKSEGGIPVYGSNGITGYHDEALIEKGIIIGRKGSIGEVEYSEQPFWPIDTTFYVEESPERDIRFTYYLLKSLPLQEMNSDSAVPGLNRNAAHSLKIKVPNLAEQKRIAHILGTLDDKIELNQRMNETLEAIARAIFKSWFVDFDPVKAKMTGESYPLPEEIIALFPDELVESELGMIPKGWEVSTINDEIELVGGGTPSTRNPKYWENGIYNFATPKDLSNLSSIFLLDTDRKVTHVGLNKISSGLLEPGTLLMSSRAPVGYLAINKIPVCINQGFIAMKFNKRLTANYMLNWAKTHMEEIKSRASGTTFSELSKRNFRPMKILVPSQEIIIAFNDYISTIFDQISLNLELNKNLVSQRESLLDQLI